MADNGTLIIISLTVLSIGIAFIAVSNFLSKHRERLINSSVAYSLTETQDSGAENKRQLERVNTKLPVTLEIDGCKTEAQTTNISISGAFVSYSPPLNVGERFNITLDIPDSEEIIFEGEVIWNNTNVPDDKIVSRGMGIRFLRITTENREILNKILRASHEEKAVS